MCPLWPIYNILLFFGLLLVSLRTLDVVAQGDLEKWNITFEPSEIKELFVGDVESIQVKFNATELIGIEENFTVLLEYLVQDSNIAEINPEFISLNFSDLIHLEESGLYPSFNLTGSFLGYTKVCVRKTQRSLSGKESVICSDSCCEVTVLREKSGLDTAFVASVAGLVGIIYINMGAALDTKTVMATIKKPIGPAIGFFAQFFIMPVLAYVIGKALITLPSLQLGLFVTGCSPGGGASNIWTLTLGGNLDLSITMTTISTFSAFVMMPLWILTVGGSIMQEANIGIPYKNIAYLAIALIVPLIIGVIIQRTLPKIARFLVRILKPFALILIIFIVVFAIYTNLFLFELFTWEILVSGLLLPWLGYFLGGGTAWLLRQRTRDVIAIGIETGVQNTGLAILALRLSLPAPESDLTTVLPVAVAIMTPIIPLAILCFQKATGKYPDQDPGKHSAQFRTSSSSVESTIEKPGPEV